MLKKVLSLLLLETSTNAISFDLFGGWVKYDHKDLLGPDAVGTIRMSDYKSIDDIKAFVLDHGHNAFTIAGGKAHIKDMHDGVELQDLTDCSGCQTWVYETGF